MIKRKFAVMSALLLTAALNHGQVEVELLRAPNDGFRPRAVLDAAGVLHIVQGRREQRGDLFYLRREPDGSDFAQPLQVNSTPGSVAGFDMAVGQNGRVHVLIRPNARYSQQRVGEDVKLKFFDLKYMLYARLREDGAGFEEERDLSGPTIGFEGAGAILADGRGEVHAFWHGQLEETPDESVREIFRVTSRDAGRSFTRPEAISADVVGACRCCALSTAFGADGSLLLAFRNSTTQADVPTKDSYLLVSEDAQESFASTLLDPWERAGCPGSIAAVTANQAGVFVGWRTGTRVHFAFARAGAAIVPITASEADFARLPITVANSKGQVLLLWSRPGGRAAKGGGDLVWRVFDPGGSGLSAKHVLPWGVARGWGAPTAVARADGSFVIVYDGEAEPLDARVEARVEADGGAKPGDIRDR